MGNDGGGSNSNDVKMAEAAAAGQKAQAEANERARKAEAAARAEIEKLRIAEEKRADELAKAAERERAKEAAEADKRQKAQEKAIQAMKDADAEKARIAKAEQKKRDIVHAEELKRMEAKRKQEEEAHRKKMRDMIIQAKKQEVADKKQQRDNAVEQMRASVKVVDDQINQDSDELKGLEEQYKTADDQLTNLTAKIKNFKQKPKKKDEVNDTDDPGDTKEEEEEDYLDEEADYVDPVYVKAKDDMLNALRIFQRDDDEIWAAIEKTGQREDNVGRFLKLTHRLIGETMASQDQANKLDAELHTFSELISRECQDNVTIEHLFTDKYKLERFIPILAKQTYTECQELVCDKEEFEEEILHPLQQEIGKEIKEWKKKHPNEVGDAWDIFLEKYKLKKFKQGLENAGFDDFEAIDDLETDEDIDDTIKEANITGLFKKKFKRAINDYKADPDKYKPAESEKNDDQDDDKEQDTNEDPRPLEVSIKEKRILRQICTEPDTWKKYETEKRDLTKKALVYTSPVLGGFFMKMNVVVKQAQKLLNYSPQMNEEQNKAMEAVMQSVKSPKAIEAPGSTADDDNKAPDEDNDNEQDEHDEQKAENPTDDNPEKLPDYAQRKGWKEASEVQVYSKTDSRWYDGKIKDITNDDEGEWLNIEYVTAQHKKEKQVNRFGDDIRDPVSVECRAITAAIEVDINVTDIMMAKFELNDTTLRVLPVAQGVEESTKAILQCQAQIRGSVKLAGSILKLKPANLTDAAKPLWKAVDDGIIHIIEGALEMSKISAQYFGFFLRFNQSFQRFVSMNQENKEVSLFTSLEHIKKDIRDFSAFKKEFNSKVQELSAQAMQVIQNCVTEHIGVEVFESTRAAREQSERDYLNAKAKYDVERLRLDTELENLKNKRSKDLGEVAAFNTRIKQLKQRKEDNERFKESWMREIDELMKINFDSGGALDKLVGAEADKIKQ